MSSLLQTLNGSPMLKQAGKKREFQPYDMLLIITVFTFCSCGNNFLLGVLCNSLQIFCSVLLFNTTNLSMTYNVSALTSYKRIYSRNLLSNIIVNQGRKRYANLKVDIAPTCPSSTFIHYQDYACSFPLFLQ